MNTNRVEEQLVINCWIIFHLRPILFECELRNCFAHLLLDDGLDRVWALVRLLIDVHGSGSMAVICGVMAIVLWMLCSRCMAVC